ncbi:MAG: 30S ribosomal protein S8 [Candidatus Gottesmanbacteria bacterium]
MFVDPIANLLSIIKNGYLAKKKQVVVPYSRFGQNLLKILVDEGYLKEIKKQKTKNKKQDELVILLKYDGKKPVMTDIKKVSKPGLRVYVGKMDIPRVLSGLGINIVSTSAGLMVDKEARQKGYGGEIICKVW